MTLSNTSAASAPIAELRASHANAAPTLLSVAAPRADDAHAGMSRLFLIAFCGLVFAINPFSCDILLPALFPIARDLGVSITQAQMTIPVYLMFAAAGQVIFGPMSDKYGRKPVLLVGLALYIVASLLAAVAPSLVLLLAARVLQGLGASCAIVLARAVMRDTHSGEDLARALSMSMAIFTAGPLLAPLIGAAILSISSWRTTFWGLVALGTALLVVTAVQLKETNRAPDADALQLARLKAGTAQVMLHPQSLRFIIVTTLFNWNIVMLISSMPRVFKSQFGYEGSEFAVVFALCTVGIVVGQIIQHRAIRRMGLLATLRAGAFIFIGAVVAMALAARLLHVTVPLFAALMFLFNMTFLAVAAVCLSLVLEPHREIAGLASSLFGASTHFIGSGLALLSLPYLNGTLAQWSLVQAAIIVTACTIILTWRPLWTGASERASTG